MNKKITVFLVIFIILILGSLIFLLVYEPENNNILQKNNSLLYQEKDTYTAEDFPNFKDGPEELTRLIDNLNKEYVLLKESDRPYTRWIQIGLIKKSLKDYEGAENAWRSAVSLVERPIIAYGNLADLYFHYLRDYEKAEEYYEKSIELNPRSFTYREGLADLYRYDLKEKDDLVEGIMLEGVKQSSEDKIIYYAYLFDFFTEKGNIEKKKEYETKIKEIDPEWTSFIQNIELQK